MPLNTDYLTTSSDAFKTSYQFASAKVNLFLHITGRRENGYHELESLFVFTRLGDRLSIQQSDVDQLEITGPFAQALIDAGGQGEDNLIFQAIKLVRKGEKKRLVDLPPVKVILNKVLPIGAGIGGGSADAAACLRLLNDYWALDLCKQSLADYALQLGADVPACLNSKPKFVQGIGERTQEISIQLPKHIVLVNPRVHVATPSIFKAYKDQSGAFDGVLKDPIAVMDDINGLCRYTKNSLTNAAQQLTPSIQSVLEVMENTHAAQMVRMSGSGATCFALYDSSKAAQQAAQAIRQNNSAWWVQVDEIICHHDNF